MDPTTYSRMHAMVEKLLGAEAEQWPALLDRLCGEEVHLRERVLELARLTNDGAGAFTDAGIDARRDQLDEALDVAASSAVDGAWMPERVGPYTILELIGRGGSGVVFRAQQERPHREVALKLLSPAFATPSTMARLEREAEILGRLQHPGIAQVFDAGRFDGGFGSQPYLVMELIRGVDVVTHARRQDLSRSARIELVIAVLEAVQHAHGREVLHRDLKPDNVLVDEEGRPRLLDFGIARIAERSGAVTAFTGDKQLLGTAAYMPPEQAAGKGSRVGPTCDVFAIGAIAYELITGRRPRNLEGLSITQALAELTGQTIPAPRQVDPSVPRDLDTVIGTALDDEPARRYQSAGAFAADLQRVLESRPIAARPPGAAVRVAKWVARNRAVTLGACATVAVLAVGLVATLIQASRARAASERAERGRYAAEMLVESSMVMDPVTQGRAADTLERWAPGAPTAAPVDALGEERWEWHLLRSVESRRGVMEIGVGDGPMGAAWHPDGSRVAVVHARSIALYDASTGELLEGIELPPGGDALLLGVAFDPAGERIAACGAYRTVVWRPDGQGGALELDALTSGACDVHWRGEHTLWVSGHELHVFDLQSGTQTTPVSDSVMPMQGLVLHPDRGTPLVFDGGVGLTWMDVSGAHASEVLKRGHWSYASVAPDPTGEWFAATTFDTSVLVVAARTGDVRWRSDVHGEPILDCDWHPTRSRVATGADDGTVRVFDGETGAVLSALGGSSMPVRDVHWSPDGTRLMSVSTSDRVSLWNPETRVPVRRIRPPSAERDMTEAGRLSWCPSRRELFVAHRGGWTVYCLETSRFDPDRGAWPQSIVDDSGGLEAWVGNGSRLCVRAIGEEDAQVSELQLGDDTFIDLDWAGGSRVLAAANKDGLWRVDVPAAGADGALGALEATRLLVPGIQFTDLRVDPLGQLAAGSSTYSKVFVAALDGSRAYEIDLGAGRGARSVAWGPRGDRFAIGTYSGSIHLFDASDGRELGVLLGAARQLHSVAWHPSGDRIAAGGRDGTVKIWSVGTGALVASYPVPDHVSDLAWIEEGRMLACLGFDGVVTLWDASASLIGARRR